MDGLLIDVGQTGVRWRLGGATRELRSDGVGADGAASVLAMIERAVPRGAAGAPVAVLGITGDFGAEDRARLRSGLLRVLGVPEVRVVHDSITAFLGALGRRPGVVTMCGTGAVTLAWDGATPPRRFDGLGPYLGDRGGGASLSRDGLRAAMSAIDGSGPGTRLAAVLSEAWPDPARLVVGIREGEAPAVEFARDFTHAIGAAAHDGDPVATGLVRASARAAAATTVAAAREDDAISYAGAMFRAFDDFLPAWRAAVLAARPGAVIVEPLGDALDGARVLAAADGELLRLMHADVIREGTAP